jgi:hypothetical protein
MTIIIDNPDRTRLQYMSLYYRLKLEVETPNGPTWRQPPAKMIRAIMITQGLKDPGPRKKAIFNAFGDWLLEQKIILKHEHVS